MMRMSASGLEAAATMALAAGAQVAQQELEMVGERIGVEQALGTDGADGEAADGEAVVVLPLKMHSFERVLSKVDPDNGNWVLSAWFSV